MNVNREEEREQAYLQIKSIKKMGGGDVSKATNYDRNWFSAREHEAILFRFARAEFVKIVILIAEIALD